jgi:hypothetical protein
MHFYGGFMVTVAKRSWFLALFYALTVKCFGFITK